MAGADFRVSLGHRGVRTVEVVRAARPNPRTGGDPLGLATAQGLRLAERAARASSPSGAARMDWAIAQAPQEDIYALIPAHPGIRHATWRPSAVGAGHRHVPRVVDSAPPPSTPQRMIAARAGLLTPAELLEPLATMYAVATDRLLSGGVRILFGPNGSERTTRGTRQPRPPVLSGGRFVPATKLIQLHPVDMVDPAFSLAQIIDYLRFITDAYALGDRFAIVFRPWNDLPEPARAQVRYAWTLAQVYVDALRHAANLRTLGYTVDREPWNTWLRDPSTAIAAIYEEVIENCGLADQPWSRELLSAMERYPLRALRNGKR